MKRLLRPPADAAVFQYTTTPALASGDFVVLGTSLGVAVALNAIAAGGTGPVAIAGQVRVTKVAGQAWAVGDRVYLVAGTQTFNRTAAGNTLAGMAIAAAASGDTVGFIVLKEPTGAA